MLQSILVALKKIKIVASGDGDLRMDQHKYLFCIQIFWFQNNGERSSGFMEYSSIWINDDIKQQNNGP